MNYATQNYIGNYKKARTETAKATAPTVGRVLSLDAKTKRCQRSSERQTKISTTNDVANGFLKCTFLPKLEEAKTIQACQKTAKTERDFYQSLSQIADHYGIEPMQTNQFEFPYNIALGIWNLKENLKQSIPNWDAINLIQDSNKTYFVSEERYNTGTTLYYIPTEPLYKMLHDRKRKKNAQLLVSVFSYLYHIVAIPYFRQENSYLYWMYEMQKDWVEQDDETDETEKLKSELKQAEQIGNCIEQKIFNRINLKVFKQRLNTFKIRDVFDKECFKIAENAFEIYDKYPITSVFRNASSSEDNNCNDDIENEIIGMEKYISFISNTKGWLYESIEENINNEFNECGVMAEPTVSKTFNGKEITKNNLDFENRLFPILNDLCSLLYNYETSRK